MVKNKSKKPELKFRKIQEYDSPLVYDGDQRLYNGDKRIIDTDFSSPKEYISEIDLNNFSDTPSRK